MADFSISNAAAIAGLNSVTGQLGTGAKLRIYSGAVPVNVDAALGGATLLAELSFSATAFGGATDDGANRARANANTITGAAASATGTASFYRAVTSAGTGVGQGDVSATGGGGDLQLNSTSITSGAQVDVSALTWRQPQKA